MQENGINLIYKNLPEEVQKEKGSILFRNASPSLSRRLAEKSWMILFIFWNMATLMHPFISITQLQSRVSAWVGTKMYSLWALLLDLPLLLSIAVRVPACGLSSFHLESNWRTHFVEKVFWAHAFFKSRVHRRSMRDTVAAYERLWTMNTMGSMVAGKEGKVERREVHSRNLSGPSFVGSG